MISKVLLTTFILLFTTLTFADKPKCYAASAGYCQYTGKISRIYVNNDNIILLYFDTQMDDGEWDVAGFTATSKFAGAVSLDTQNEFAKLFYSTALAAQSTKRKITVQMRGNIGGYLKIDRIWLDE
ncbi:hypothetical protein [Pleionea litopenaei]|uniref:Uncharacterized protein n=1 Tax=Pleionea litopenaei TaxID=3070815 RepID=A0AA51RR63_9GAMM|nr:hypothetical protein [Pleionea sp. HL-JVS1]WMS86042.1 hypothetical protein Q9312_12520 [Pleionea sp. HL-JVS1]